MIRLLARSLAVALSLAAVLAAVGAAPASAHERRTAGAFQFVVGWGDEPAYSGFKNSVQVTITEAGGGAAVTDVTDSLKVEVMKGPDKMTAPLVPNFRVGAFGTPGDYRAWVTPTRPGSYTFHVTGSIRGQNVDESFSSSRTTFNDIEDGATIQFPAKDPTTGQLATRVDREVPRLDAAVDRAEDRAGTAQTLGFIGLAVGVLGLVVAAIALVVVRRAGGGQRDRRRPEDDTAPEEQPQSLSR
ncbi:MAG: hypothetical protein M3326_10875 [Actinomycetota bacterium]|nr:hypothetical protein [Actinomycetota bacterium]